MLENHSTSDRTSQSWELLESVLLVLALTITKLDELDFGQHFLLCHVLKTTSIVGAFLGPTKVFGMNSI